MPRRKGSKRIKIAAIAIAASTMGGLITPNLGFAQDKSLKFGVFYINSLGFYAGIRKGVDVGASQSSIKIIDNVSNDNPVPEAGFVDTLISAGVNAVLISPTSADASVASVERLVKAGIPVVCYNTCLNETDAKRLAKAFITTDQYRFGYDLGVAAAAWAKKNNITPKLGLLNCDRYEICQDRKRGFLAALHENGGYGVVADQEAFIVDAATKIATDMLTANPNINMMYAAAEGGTEGAVLAVEYSNRAGKTVVFGSDVTTQMIEALQDGTILKAIIAQQPQIIGRMAVEKAIALAKGDTGTFGITIVESQVYRADDKHGLTEWLKAHPDGVP